MPIEIIVALIIAIPPMLLGVANFMLLLRTSAKVDIVQTHTNGLMERAEAKSKEEGVTQGHAEAAANTAANERARGDAAT